MLDVQAQYTAVGTTAEQKSIIDNLNGKAFKQDYVTEATFTINSLKQALVTIPDLRNPAVELGLSVDLQWKPVISFDYVIE